MRIRIFDDACDRYAVAHKAMVNWEWLETLSYLEGIWCNVETLYVFSNQYSISPVLGVSDYGLRIMEESVSEIDYEGDYLLEVVHTMMRKGKVRCHHYKHHPGAGGIFVDLHGNLPPEVEALQEKPYNAIFYIR